MQYGHVQGICTVDADLSILWKEIQTTRETTHQQFPNPTSLRCKDMVVATFLDYGVPIGTSYLHHTRWCDRGWRSASSGGIREG